VLFPGRKDFESSAAEDYVSIAAMIMAEENLSTWENLP
jgi:hypothetical protein